MGPLATAAIFACLIGASIYFRASSPELPKQELKRLRRALLLTALSLLLLSAICEVLLFGGNWGFVAHRAFLFWLIFSEIVVNGVAVFCLLRPLLKLLPLSKGDASEISSIGMAFGFMLGLVEAFLCFFEFGLMLMD